MNEPIKVTAQDLLDVWNHKKMPHEFEPQPDKDLKKLCEATQDGALKEMFKKQEYCSGHIIKDNECSICHLPLPPQPKGIEPIKYEDIVTCDYGDTDRIIDYLLVLAKKINEVIRLIREER